MMAYSIVSGYHSSSEIDYDNLDSVFGATSLFIITTNRGLDGVPMFAIDSMEKLLKLRASLILVS
jgi:hypothetical protein